MARSSDKVDPGRNINVRAARLALKQEPARPDLYDHVMRYEPKTLTPVKCSLPIDNGFVFRDTFVATEGAAHRASNIKGKAYGPLGVATSSSFGSRPFELDSLEIPGTNMRLQRMKKTLEEGSIAQSLSSENRCPGGA